jgi:thiol-disulfide isomerase/thioredoxin
MSRRLPLVLACAGLSLAGCDREPHAPAQPQSNASAPAAADAGDAGDGFVGKIDRSHKGSAMPQASLTDAAGARMTLASLNGKPVLINLWATWCAPCVKELPTLDALAARETGRLAVVTVSQDMAPTDKSGGDKVAAALAAHSHGHLHPWLDPDNTLGFFYNSGELPTSVLYDANGHEVWRMVGAHDWSGADSQGLIAPAMP